MLSALVPPGVVAWEVWSDVEEPLFPAEESYIERAVARRRAEFTTVRHCARRALAGLGLERPVMVPGERGEPVWPTGVVGAMTHCEGYRAAAVAWQHEVDALGVDAEPNQPLPRGVLRMVASAEEREGLRILSRQRPEVAFDRLLFSVKESVYKAWFPRERRWLGFEDAQVRIRLSDGVPGGLTGVPQGGPGGSPSGGSREAPSGGLPGALRDRWSWGGFSARLLVATATQHGCSGACPGGYSGAWVSDGAHLVTAVTVPA